MSKLKKILHKEQPVFTLPQRVKKILDKYPAGDAHLYIPGAQIPVLGPELVVNGDFSNGLTGWNKYGADATANAGEVALTATAAMYPQITSAPITIVPGRVYQVQGTCRSGVNSQPLAVRPSPAQGANYTTTTSAVDTVKSCTFLATVSTINVLAMMETASATVGSTAYFKNISVREVLSYTDRISNFGAGNFADTAGSKYANTKVDQPVGRVNDAASGLGPELLTNGDFSAGAAWPATAGFSISGEALNINSPTQYAGSATMQSLKATIGKTYQVSFEVKNWVSGRVKYILGGVSGPVSAGNGKYSAIITATGGSELAYIQALDVGVVLSIDNISVREVIGTHAQQTATNYQPTLRRGVVNLLLYSNDFTNPSWAKINATLGTASTVLPNGDTSSTTKLEETSSTTQHAIRSGVATIPASTQFTFSASLKAAERTKVYVQINDGTSSNAARVLFDLATGTISSPPAVILASLTGLSATITPEPNGWYRVSFTCTLNTVPNAAVYIGTSEGGLYSFSGTVGAGFHLYAPQIVLGPVAGVYSPTTTAAASNPDAGLYSWQFDGADDYLKLDKPLFGMADDHCVIAGVKCTSLTNSMSIFDQRSSSSTNPVMCKLAILPTTGALTVQWRDDTGTTLVSPNAGSCVIGESFVFTGRKIGDVKGCRKNGGVYYVDPTPLGTATINSASIGATVHSSLTMFFAGNVYIVIAIKGTVSNTDLLVLEKWIGQMSGVNI